MGFVNYIYILNRATKIPIGKLTVNQFAIQSFPLSNNELWLDCEVQILNKDLKNFIVYLLVDLGKAKGCSINTNLK